jgi:putative glycosyltransferase (TIGR04372 family)
MNKIILFLIKYTPAKYIYSYTRKFYYKIKFILLIILNIPSAIIVLLISPFIKIKISEIEIRAIGHSTMPIEIFLSELKCNIHNTKGVKYIWFINDGIFPNEKKKISNSFLLKKWREKLTIGPRFIFEPLFYIFRFLRIIRIGNYFLAPYRHCKDIPLLNTPKYISSGIQNPWQSVDIHNVLPRTEPQIKFTEEEEELGQKYLDKYNLKKNNYILFSSRTSEFRNDTKVNSRNANIKNQIFGLKKICKEKNLKAVRIGYSPKEKIDTEDNNIIDYSNSEDRTEFLDIYLSFNCKFVIGSASGVYTMALLNRKKVLIVNHGHLSEFRLCTWTAVPFILPKKYKNLKTNKLVKYSEAFKKGLVYYENYPDEIKHYTWIDNTEIEIYEAISEMNDYIDGNLVKDDENLQNKFWKIFLDNFGYNPESVKVSPSFLISNKDFI